MKKPNKVINISFEIDENGIITAIYCNQACNDFVKAVIKRAHEDIETGLILDDPAPQNELIPPGEKSILDAMYILGGGHFDNLASEDK